MRTNYRKACAIIEAIFRNRPLWLKEKPRRNLYTGTHSFISYNGQANKELYLEYDYKISGRWHTKWIKVEEAFEYLKDIRWADYHIRQGLAILENAGDVNHKWQRALSLIALTVECEHRFHPRSKHLADLYKITEPYAFDFDVVAPRGSIKILGQKCELKSSSLEMQKEWWQNMGSQVYNDWQDGSIEGRLAAKVISLCDFQSLRNEMLLFYKQYPGHPEIAEKMMEEQRLYHQANYLRRWYLERMKSFEKWETLKGQQDC